MKEQKKNESSQQIYRVRVYKDFDFPSFSINHRNRLEDLTYNALEEVKEHAHRGEHFKCEIINILPFSLKASEELENLEKNRFTDLNFFIREVALNDTQETYGELNFDKNPNLFIKTQDDKLTVKFSLKPEIETFFINRIQTLSRLFENKTVNV